MKKHHNSNDLGLKPSEITHASSTDKSTTLHYKNGSRTTIAHNVLGPKQRQQLKALEPMARQAATESQVQESQDQHQYGKVIMKADGGVIDAVSNAASAAADWLGGDTRAITKEHDEHKAKTDASLRHANEAPSNYADGGKVTEKQFDHMKMIADLTAAGHHDAAKACYEKYCSGGDVGRKMYAQGMQVDAGNDDSTPVAAPQVDENGGVRSQDTQPGVGDRIMSGIKDFAGKMMPAAQQIAVGGEQSDRAPAQIAPAEQVSMAESDSDSAGAHANEAPPAQQPPAPQPTPATAKEAGIGQIDHRAFEANQAPPQQQAYYNKTKATDIHDILSENKAFQQDLNEGHISPKTYSQLMFSNPDGSDKSTLGKIGSIFGMMLSSMGAGLSHQPNLFLEMMNKQIDNDLKAQQDSVSNKQNAYKINQQRLQEQAGIENVNQDTKSKAYALTRMQMQQSAFHSLTERVNAMPVGSPERQQAEQSLAMMMPYIQNDQFNMVDRLAAASAYAKVMSGQSGSGGTAGSEEAFKAKQRGLQVLGAAGNSGAQSMLQYNQARHLPYVKGEASHDINDGDRKKISDHDILDNKLKDLISFAKQHKGSVDPKILQQAAQKAEETTALYNQSVDGLGMTQGRMDWLGKQIKDNPTSLIQQILGNNKRLEEIQNANQMRKNEFLEKNLGFPKQRQDEEIRYYGGKKYKRGSDGKPVEVK